MLKKIKLKTKLSILIFILTLVMIYLGGMLIFSYYTKISSLNKLNERIVLSSNISDTLHSLQKERGLSCGYVVNKNQKFKKELILQRKQSNKKLKNLQTILNTMPCSEFKKSTKNYY